MGDFRFLGCFHYLVGDDGRKDNPVGELEAALQDHEDKLPDSLIVLPEALNVRQFWAPPGQEWERIDGVPEGLVELARRTGATFVAGLAIAEGSGIYNTACLISPAGWEVISRKVNVDAANGCGPYALGASASEPVPIISLRGLNLAALVCLDATIGRDTVETARQRRTLLLSTLGGLENPVLCVPMNTRYGTKIGSDHPEITFCVANCSGFTRDGGESRIFRGEVDLAVASVVSTSVPFTSIGQ